MKVASDVKLNKIVQRLLSLLGGKADSTHTHTADTIAFSNEDSTSVKDKIDAINNAEGASLQRTQKILERSDGEWYESANVGVKFYIITLKFVLQENQVVYASSAIDANFATSTPKKLMFHFGDYGTAELSVKKVSNKHTFTISSEPDAGSVSIEKIDGYYV